MKIDVIVYPSSSIQRQVGIYLSPK